MANESQSVTESYTEKTIRVTISLDDGGKAITQHVLEGFAIDARITKQGMPELPTANVAIFGLKESQLSDFTMLSFDALTVRRNFIEIEAGEKGKKLSSIFYGEIANSVPDFNAAPSPVLNIEAITASYPALIPSAPVAVAGSQTADALMKQFAAEAGIGFRNEGVSGSIANSVINGDPLSKMQWVANTLGADLIIDDREAVLMPADKVRGNEVAVRVINPDTGEIGYPSFDNMGVRASCFFAPDLQIGGYCKIESAFKRATGIWKIYQLEHSLSAYKPGGGAWATNFAATWIEKA